MHHRSTKTRPTKPCLRRRVDPHLVASGVCEKERKSELNSRAAGNGVWHLPKALSENLLLPPNALGQHVGAPAGWVEVRLGLLARARSRTTPSGAGGAAPTSLAYRAQALAPRPESEDGCPPHARARSRSTSGSSSRTHSSRLERERNKFDVGFGGAVVILALLAKVQVSIRATANFVISKFRGAAANFAVDFVLSKRVRLATG